MKDKEKNPLALQGKQMTKLLKKKKKVKLASDF